MVRPTASGHQQHSERGWPATRMITVALYADRRMVSPSRDDWVTSVLRWAAELHERPSGGILEPAAIILLGEICTGSQQAYRKSKCGRIDQRLCVRPGHHGSRGGEPGLRRYRVRKCAEALR